MNTTQNRILIVDNEIQITNMLKLALESMGSFHVKTENDPAHALAAAREFMPDLIIMDVKMPGLDGADVAIQLQEDKSFSETPIVFVTGTVTSPEIVRHGTRPGGLRFLPKTMRLGAMVACLKDILREGDGLAKLSVEDNRAA